MKRPKKGKPTVFYPEAAATTVSVREAKAHFSALVGRASAGEEIVVVNRGAPVARIGPVHERGAKPFRVDLDWLRSMPVDDRSPTAEQIIREDRDARG